MGMTLAFHHFGVIGGGAWGTALAQALLRAGRDATLWAREPEVVDAIISRRENPTYLPAIPLDARLKATNALEDLAACDAWLLVTPTQHTRALCRKLAALDGGKKPPALICAKGVEQETLMLPGAIVAEELPRHALAVLSGPTFAAEVARAMPTALTLACADETLGTALAQAISSSAFRIYYSDDATGAQIGGAIKNVLAVACGIAAGCGMGDNARAALITRGLAEMMRLGVALGGRPETLMGLSGLGDLALTCSSPQSRNMSLGMALGQGQKLKDILAGRRSVAEGVFTAAAAAALARQHGIDMPIVAAVDAVLNHGVAVDATIASLLARPLRPERA